jgi:transposase
MHGMDRNSLQVLLAQGLSVEQIARRFNRHPSTVSYWLRKHGLEAPHRAKHAAKGGIERARLTELVGRGMTIAQIADEVQRSTATVRHWLRRYDLATTAAVRARAGRAGHSGGQSMIERDCVRHGRTEFVSEGRGYYRCRRCRSEEVVSQRRTLEQALVAGAGGACAVCGYARCPGALELHHLDPAPTRVQIGRNGVTPAVAEARRAVRECVLLCANCHAEVESGMVALPDTVVGDAWG